MDTFPRWTRRALAALMILATVATATACAPVNPTQPGFEKIDPELLDTLNNGGTTTFWVRLGARPDLSAVGAATDWASRGQAVVDALHATADASQGSVLAQLSVHQPDSYERFWITNSIRVTGEADVAVALAGNPAVVAIDAPETLQLPEPAPIVADDPDAEPAAAPGDTEWGIDAIGAPAVWEQTGRHGEGIVVANIDTGVQFDHPALRAQYRGTKADGSVDHAYNWFDPTGTCPDAPCDDVGHGTHTMGTMVGDAGDPGSNRIGVAPGAQWMAAKGCGSASCTDADLLAAAQWLLAPTDPMGANPRPDLRPQIIDTPLDGPGDPWFRDVVRAWTAAGIFAPIAAGNSGPLCGTASSPGEYLESYAAGAYGPDGNIAGFSGRGPNARDDTRKPDIAAPGVDVRSAVPGGYATTSGTSMASSHVAGAVALMWSAAPSTIGNVELARWILDSTAVDVDDPGCGGTAGDNNVWGEGRLDALAATTKALDPGLGVTTLVVDSPDGVYPLGASVLAAYHCVDDSDPHPTCTGDVADGAPIDTSTAGRHELHFALGNRFGYTGTATVTYDVFACNGQEPTIVGGAGDDHLVGTPGDDVIYDVAGNNTIDAGEGNDTICTGPGDDVIDTGNGDDWVDAAGGANLVDAGDDNTVATLEGNDVVITGDGMDRITAGDGANVIESGAGNDVISAQQGTDTINAAAGDDEVDAGDGANTILLGAGDDQTIAGRDADLIDGGPGTDSCNPGEGANRVTRCES